MTSYNLLILPLVLSSNGINCPDHQYCNDDVCYNCSENCRKCYSLTSCDECDPLYTKYGTRSSIDGCIYNPYCKTESS